MGIVLTAFLAACGQDDPVPTDVALPEPIEVELTVPETADTMEPVKLTTLVTQGAEKVEDATEVEYEIWQEGKKEDSIFIETTNDKGGIYSAETTFARDGTYQVQVHVTARAMHVMPVKQIHIGDVAVDEDHQEMGEDEHSTTTDDKHSHGEMLGIELHFMQPIIEEQTQLMLHAEKEGKAFENLEVRFEIIQPNEEVQSVAASENKPGEYTASTSFLETGIYKVIAHARSDDFHSHKERTIEVK